MKAINWATAMVDNRKWRRVMWRSDAKGVVDMLLSRGVLTSWWYHYDILEFQHRLKDSNWRMEWIPRGSKCGADSVAKYARSCNRSFLFEGDTLVDVPPCILVLLSLEFPLVSSFL